MKVEDLQGLCKDILESDRSIRFVGISDKMGKQIASSYRAELVPLLTPTEIEMSAIESVLRMKTRKDFESKLGKPIYTFTLYQKIKRVTITLQNKNNNKRYYPILMVSFDIGANHDSIIINKILPIIRGQQYSTLL